MVRRATVLDGRPGGRTLGDADLRAAADVCARDAVGSVLASSRIDHAAIVGLRSAGGHLWGYQQDGELLAVCWAGANVVPVVPVDDAATAARALDAFASLARREGRRCSSIVGPSEAVLGLWDRLRGSWSPARDVRADQPSMVIDHDPRIAADPTVRRTRTDEYDCVLPACIAMFTEEVGYSPAGGPNGPYEMRVRGLIGQGRSFVRLDDAPPSRPAVVFKAELGAVSGGVAQVQGVWVTPRRRGEGLSEAGMAAVVAQTRRDVAPTVSLYVNAFNTRAVAAYHAVGFRQVGTYSTVLF